MMSEINEKISVSGYQLSLNAIKKAIYGIYDLSHQIKDYAVKAVPLSKNKDQLVIYIELCSNEICNACNINQLVYEFIKELKKEGQYYREFVKSLDSFIFPEIKLVYKPKGSL